MEKIEMFTAELVMKDKEPNIRLFGRDENKKKIDLLVKSSRPYFYILESEENLIDFECDKEPGFKSIYKDRLIKILVDNPFDIKTLKTKFSKCFESDINPVSRFLIDNSINTSFNLENGNITPAHHEITPRIMMLDIETQYYGGSNKEMSAPINCISFHDNYTNKFYTIAFNKDNSVSERKFKFLSEAVKDKNKIAQEFECEEYIVSNEKELLNKFKEFVISMDIDIFSGWNVIKFDMIYILKRMEFYRLNPEDLSPLKKYYYSNEYINSGSFKNMLYKSKEAKVMIRGRAIVDLLRGFKRLKWKQISSFALDAIGQAEFNIGKIEYDGWIGEFWEKDFSKFLDYNRRDIEICLAINNQYSVLDFLLNLRRITGCELSDVHFNSRMIDVYILRKCNGKFVLPDKVFKDNLDREKIEGGFVLDPKVGLFKNIAALDMKSLYPSIMLSLNMSPETIDDDGSIKVPNGVKFNSETGILKEVLVDLLNKRDEIRKKLKDSAINSNPSEYLKLYKYQYAYKTFSNSLYGVTLFPSFRLFDSRIGASITYTGRYLTKRIIEYVKSCKYDVIRADTDSSFVDFHETDLSKAIEKGKELEKQINTMFPIWFAGWNNDTSLFSIKSEKIYDTLYSGEEKKLYGGNIVWDWEKGVLEKEEIEIKGFAAKRSDRSHFSRDLQKHIFEMIFHKKSKEEILKFILEETDKLINLKYDFEYIGIPKAITKDRTEYKVDNPWLRGIKWSEENIKGFSFTPKPYLLYLKSDKKYITDVICFTDNKQVPGDIKIDFKKMADTCIYNILKKILPIINMSNSVIENYISNKCNKQRTLFEMNIGYGTKI